MSELVLGRMLDEKSVVPMQWGLEMVNAEERHSVWRGTAERWVERDIDGSHSASIVGSGN